MHQDIHDGDIAGYFARGNKTGEDEVSAESARAGGFLEAVSPGAVTDEQEFHPRTPFDELGRDRQQIVMPFELE